MNKNLIARIAVAAVAIPAILWVVYQGGEWLFGMVMLFAIVAGSEYFFDEGCRPSRPMFWTALVSTVLVFWSSTGFAVDGCRVCCWITTCAKITPLGVLTAFFLISGMALGIGKLPPNELFRRHTRLVWGVVYVGLLYPFVFRVGDGVGTLDGGDSLLFLFGVLWVGDSAAMFLGKAFGKHKLAPAVSPNKTVEGFVGGIVGALAVGAIMYFWKLEALGAGHVLALTVGCSVFGQLGDLVESMWKRSLGIKDSSALIPGHGGILDRFDSLLFAAPFMYAYLTYAL